MTPEGLVILCFSFTSVINRIRNEINGCPRAKIKKYPAPGKSRSPGGKEADTLLLLEEFDHGFTHGETNIHIGLGVSVVVPV